jgi:4-amino-4-deoxy-L-arabinose transferase-like glycosyltransferase
VLPFLLLAILVVFAWARPLAVAAAGLLAALAFTSLPPVLAYAGLATADAAAMATIVLALFAILRWMEAPTFPRTIGVGVAVGLALLAKVTALIFLPAALVVVLLAWRSAGNPVAPYVGGAAVAALAALLVVWAGYRFSIGPIHEGTSGAAAPRSEGDVAALLRLPVFPAPGYLRGALDLGREHRAGEPKPLAIVSGTPLPFLILALVGGAALALAARQRRSALVPPLGALAMLAAAMGAGIDLGIRHLLPVFPLLAVCAGVGVLTLWNRRRRGRLGMAGPVLAVGLGGWLVVDAALAHPDYLSWSNRLADWLIR